MSKSVNIAIIGLGQVGIYLYNELNSKKKEIIIKIHGKTTDKIYYFYKLQTANTEKMSRSFWNNTEPELEKIYFIP